MNLHLAEAMGFYIRHEHDRLDIVPPNGLYSLKSDGFSLYDNFFNVPLEKRGEVWRVLDNNGEGIEILDAPDGPKLSPVLVPRRVLPLALDISLPLKWGLNNYNTEDPWGTLVEVSKLEDRYIEQISMGSIPEEERVYPENFREWLRNCGATEWVINRLNVEIGAVLNDIYKNEVDEDSLARALDAQQVFTLLHPNRWSEYWNRLRRVEVVVLDILEGAHEVRQPNA